MKENINYPKLVTWFYYFSLIISAIAYWIGAIIIINTKEIPLIFWIGVILSLFLWTSLTTYHFYYTKRLNKASAISFLLLYILLGILFFIQSIDSTIRIAIMIVFAIISVPAMYYGLEVFRTQILFTSAKIFLDYKAKKVIKKMSKK